MDNKRNLDFLYSERFIFFAVFSIALVVRLWFILNFSTSVLVGDEIGYDGLSLSLLNGRGYVNRSGFSSAGRPPGYPFFLYTIFLFGGNYLFVKLLQAAIDSLMCIFIYYLGKNIFNKKVGILSAFLSAIHIGFFAQPAKILTEGLATFLLVVAMIFFYKSKVNLCNKFYYAATGFFLGAASLVRANILLIGILVGIFFIFDLIIKRIKINNICIYSIIFVLFFSIPILPWTIRNYIVFKAFIPISTYKGIAFYSSYKPKDGKIYGIIPDDDVTKKAFSISSEVEQSRFLTHETVKLLKENPFIFFKLIPLKLAYLFSPIDWELIYDRAVYNYIFAFYFPFFLFGSCILWKRFNELSPLYAPILSIILMGILLFGIPRFRLIVEPFMIIFASFGIFYLYENIRNKNRFIAILVVFLLINFSMVFYSQTIKGSFKYMAQNLGIW